MEPELIWGLLGVLILLSGACSASETALFSLSHKDRARAGTLARRLLAEPQGLLASLLLANLVVNLLFFAFAARLAAPDSSMGPWLAGLLALLAILILGEILPKTLALRAPLLVARTLSWPLALFSFAVRPGRLLLEGTIGLLFRAFGVAGRDERAITTEMLSRVLEESADDGLLAASEAEILTEVLELESIRVREIMTPRVDMLAIDLEADNPLEVLPEALARRLSWLSVIEGNRDKIVGRVRLRDLLPEPRRPLTQLVMPVKFVPEVASVMALLSVLREDRTSEAVVIDEWGGTAGVVTLEDVIEEIVGELRVEGEGRERPVVPLGEGRFRVSGSLAVRDWNEQFGLAIVPNEFETVAGLVTALLGRIPRTGDRVRLGSLVGEVHEVRGRRVLTVDMYVAAQGEGVA